MLGFLGYGIGVEVGVEVRHHVNTKEFDAL